MQGGLKCFRVDFKTMFTVFERILNRTGADIRMQVRLECHVRRFFGEFLKIARMKRTIVHISSRALLFEIVAFALLAARSATV